MLAGNWQAVQNFVGELNKHAFKIEQLAKDKDIEAVQSKKDKAVSKENKEKSFDGVFSGYLDRVSKNANDLIIGDAKKAVESRLHDTELVRSKNVNPMDVVDPMGVVDQLKIETGESALVCCPQSDVDLAALEKKGTGDTAILMRHEVGHHKGKIMMAVDGTWYVYEEDSTKLNDKKVICMYTNDSVGGDFGKWSNKECKQQAILYKDNNPKINDIYQNLRRYRGLGNIETKIYCAGEDSIEQNDFVTKAVDKELAADTLAQKGILEGKLKRQYTKAYKEANQEAIKPIGIKAQVVNCGGTNIGSVNGINTSKGKVKISKETFQGSPAQVRVKLEALKKALKDFQDTGKGTQKHDIQPKLIEPITKKIADIDKQLKEQKAKRATFDKVLQGAIESGDFKKVNDMTGDSKHKKMADFFRDQLLHRLN